MPPATPNANSTSKASPSKIANKSSAPAATASTDDALKDRVEKLETRQRAINANNIARVQNSHLRTADAKLHSLVSLKTNKSIEGFPSTAKEIQKLTESRVDALLGFLDAEKMGTKDAKLQRLRLQIGLPPETL